jgi:transcriptional regulator with XRE-family HTH domain
VDDETGGEPTPTEQHDAEGTTSLSPGELLGMRLRQIRKDKGWTLKEVSARTGLAFSTLSKVERNQLSLTYNNLAKLAEGLDLDIANLFSSEVAEAVVGRRTYLRRSEGHVHESRNYAHEYLAAKLAQRRMVPMATRIKTHSIEEFGPFDSHPGEEFVYVLEGVVDMYIEPDGPIRLRAGDSCYFDARAPHATISVGASDALVLSIISALPYRTG